LINVQHTNNGLSSYFQTLLLSTSSKVVLFTTFSLGHTTKTIPKHQYGDGAITDQKTLTQPELNAAGV
jgi:hypothetical protein